MAKSRKAKQNAYEAVTDRLVAQINDGGLPPWRKGFNSKASLYPGPRYAHNLTTKKPYRGINTLLTLVSKSSNSFTTNAWLTLKQANEAGGSVKKGEKATPIVFWGVRFVDKETGELARPGADADSDDYKKIFFARLYSVFNADQCDGLDHLMNPEGLELNQISTEELDAQDLQIVEAFEERVRETGVDLVFRDTDAAFYRPSDHMIVIPPIEQFDSLPAYFATLTHEAAHSTGSALGRNMDMAQKSDRAYEEIIAELTSTFVAAECGIDIDESRAACYIDHWSIAEYLQDNKKAIFSAASKAQEAADFLITPEFRQTMAQIRDEELMLELGEPDFELTADEGLNLEDVLAFMNQSGSVDTPAAEAAEPATQAPDVEAEDDDSGVVSMPDIHEQAAQQYALTILDNALTGLKEGQSLTDIGIVLEPAGSEDGYLISLKGMELGTSPTLEVDRPALIRAVETWLGLAPAKEASHESAPAEVQTDAEDEDDALDAALSAAIANIERQDAQETEQQSQPDEVEDDDFNPDWYIKPAADSIEQLRRMDVVRVLEQAMEYGGEDTAIKMANYVTDHRPDLSDEVIDVMKVELSIQYPTINDAVQTLDQQDDLTASGSHAPSSASKQTLDSFLNF